MSAAPAAELDHLVVAGATLAQAIEYVADLTGVAPRPGGQHTAMGTHNALVRLGERVYLELIAIDPGLPRPARPRWFDLDDAAMQSALGDQPRLIAWAARTSDIERAVASSTVDPGPAHPMSRGDSRARVTVPHLLRGKSRAGGLTECAPGKVGDVPRRIPGRVGRTGAGTAKAGGDADFLKRFSPQVV